MKKIIFLFVLGIGSWSLSPLFAKENPAELASFKKVLVEVQQGVAQNNPEIVAALSNFPKFYWEDQGFGDNLSKDTFMKNYEKMFTPEVKAKLAAAKYHRTENGDYAIEWQRKTTGYILVFEKQRTAATIRRIGHGPAD
jgi:hypothetical protein